MPADTSSDESNISRRQLVAIGFGVIGFSWIPSWEIGLEPPTNNGSHTITGRITAPATNDQYTRFIHEEFDQFHVSNTTEPIILTNAGGEHLVWTVPNEQSGLAVGEQFDGPEGFHVSADTEENQLSNDADLLVKPEYRSFERAIDFAGDSGQESTPREQRENTLGFDPGRARDRLLQLVNAYRRGWTTDLHDHRPNDRLATWIHSDVLASEAGAHAQDCIDRSFFAHENPDGEGPTDRVNPLFNGAPHVEVYENLHYWERPSGEEGLSANQVARQVFNGWRESAGHNQLLLSPRVFGPAGIGFARGHTTSSQGDTVVITSLKVITDARRAFLQQNE